MSASIYVHIPFCHSACHYCSFYFVVSPAQIQNYIAAIQKEIEARKEELGSETIQTIYFGGGTPSLLAIGDIERILKSISNSYSINADAEITIECNPENLNLEYVEGLKKLGFNRISIGVQSFFDDDLQSMNRVHNSDEAKIAIQHAKRYFDNVSIDLMFGLPYSGMNHWKENLRIAAEFGVPHISTYNLTVEEKTYLARKIARREVKLEPDDTLNNMYLYTLDFLRGYGYENYEISNFGKQDYFSRHNLAYWNSIPYLGFGPSAHSFDGHERRWNVSNLKNYLTNLSNNTKYWDSEILSNENIINEYMMTRLRLKDGMDINELKMLCQHLHDEHAFDTVLQSINPFIDNGTMVVKNSRYILSDSGKLIADYISSALMV